MRTPSRRKAEPFSRLLSRSEWQKIAERRLKFRLKQARMHAPLRKAVAMARSGGWTASVKLVGNTRMRALNRAYRKKDRPTDVLSFPAPEPFRGNGFLGDLVICLPVLKRQARQVGHSERVELDVLLVHGLLHLLGFDHENGETQAQEMRRWEATLLGRQAARSLIHRNDSGKS